MAVLTTRAQRFFTCFESTTRKKSFVPYKAIATVWAIKVSPDWSRGLSSLGIPLVKYAEGCSAVISKYRT